MHKFPDELKYSQTHEWVRIEKDGNAVVGITEHAQARLGEIVFVELPEVDEIVSASDESCVLESVKAAADVYTPLSGKIIAVNEDLNEAPGLINSDPYGDGWLFKIKMQDKEEYNDLMDAEHYKELVAEEEQVDEEH